MNLKEIGNRIKLCRKGQKLTQEKLAEKIDVSSHYIYEIERGTKTMSLSILIKTATALNVSVDYLLFGSQIDSLHPADRLSILTDGLSPKDRDNLANILSAIIPYLK